MVDISLHIFFYNQPHHQMKFDEMLEQMGPAQKTNKTDQERINDVLNHPFFMDSCKEDDMEQNTISALQSLVFDGTPEEMAENFKHQGNAAFKAGRVKFRDAIHFYTQGILAKANDREMNSLLHSNRAAVNLELMNYRSCLYDCAQAIKYNSKNIKAYFRSIKALFALDRIEEGIDCCQKALAIDPTNQAFIEFLTKLETRGEKVKELDQISQQKQESQSKKERELCDALSVRGYTLIETKDEQENVERFQHPEAPINKIRLTPEGDLTFPVVFLYPEFNQSDTISLFYETDTIYAHLQNMFQEPCPWDPQHTYNPDTLDLYFETHPEKYAKESPKLVSVLKSVHVNNAPSQSAAHRYVYVTLKDILLHPDFKIVNGLVTLIILVRNSPFNVTYRKQFKRLHE
jgi:tetratricopeptide (TPR) repeat protein